MESHGLITGILPVHVLAGVVALLFGYVALYAAKGGTVHRRSGKFFAAAMLTMSLSGALIAVLNGSSISVIAGLLTAYFVATSLLTVRPRGADAWRIDAAGAVFGVVVGIIAFSTGFGLLSSGRPETFASFVFGVVAMLAAAGDVRVLRSGGIEGRRRLSRHLWRMCFAMWVAAASFFWGPPNRVPEIIRIPALLPIPVLLPIAVMLLWLWRLRARRSGPGIVHASVSRTA
jgi:uncharacterized membrane protein